MQRQHTEKGKKPHTEKYNVYTILYNLQKEIVSLRKILLYRLYYSKQILKMKKIFLFGIVVLIFISFISVSVNAFNVTGLSHLFPLSNATDMNTNSSVVLDSVSGVTYNTGLYQNALNCSDLNEYLGTITNAEADKLQAGNYWSWTLWAKPTANTSAQRQILGTEGGYGFGTNAAGKITAHIGDSVVALITCASGNVSMTLNTWEFYTITVDLTTKTQKFYHNGSFVCSNTYTNNYEYGGATSKFKFCVEAGGTAWDFIGLVDEAYYFDRVLTLHEITELYNNGKGKFAWDFIGETGGVKPSITLLSDLQNGTVTNATSFKFFFNGTSVNNSNIYSCNVYENTTLKNSSANIDLSVQQNLSFTLLDSYERYLNFTLDCFNENASSNLSALYYVDNVKSVLDYAYPNGTYYNDEALYTNFSVSDTNLYSIEWLVYQGATLKENITHKNIVGGSYAVYNLSAVSQITGNYNWILNVWENHNPLTSPELFSEYIPTENKTSGEIIFSLNEKSYIIQSKELLDVKTETKDLKQYFTFTPLEKDIPKFYTYYLKSKHFIDYIKESQYKGHFVIWNLKRYVDFQCDDYVKVFKESDYLYRIETPCTKFETTGNLNFMQFTGNFTITTPPSLSDEYLLSINETITYYGNEINLSITNIYEVLEMLGFILINALYLVIVNYVIQPIDKRLYFFGIVPLLNLILISFKTIGLDIFTEYLFNTFVLISSIAFFVSIIILYTIGLFKPITEKTKENKKDFYGYFK